MKRIIKNVTYGVYRPMDQSAPPEDMAYNPDVLGYEYNPVKAKELLADAGFPHGFKTKLYAIPLPMSVRISTAIKPYLDEVGINVEVVRIEWGGWSQMASTSAGWNGLLTFAATTLQPDYLRTYEVGFSGRGAWLQSVDYPADLRETIGQALETIDIGTKKTLVRKINKLIIDKYCLGLFFYAKPSLAMISKEVRDLGMFEPTSYRLNPADGWLAK